MELNDESSNFTHCDRALLSITDGSNDESSNFTHCDRALLSITDGSN
jgi:hypothetical protein